MQYASDGWNLCEGAFRGYLEGNLDRTTCERMNLIRQYIQCSCLLRSRNTIFINSIAPRIPPALERRKDAIGAMRSLRGREGDGILRGILGHLGSILAPSWAILGTSWDILEASGGFGGGLDEVEKGEGVWRWFGGGLEGFWMVFGGLQAPSKPPPKRILNHLRAILAPSCARRVPEEAWANVWRNC